MKKKCKLADIRPHPFAAGDLYLIGAPTMFWPLNGCNDDVLWLETGPAIILDGILFTKSNYYERYAALVQVVTAKGIGFINPNIFIIENDAERWRWAKICGFFFAKEIEGLADA